MRFRHFGYSRSYYMHSHNSTFHSRNDELMFQDQMRSSHSTFVYPAIKDEGIPIVRMKETAILRLSPLPCIRTSVSFPSPARCSISMSAREIKR